MKTVGIVSEFNPFHNGHKYLVETSKKELSADAVVAVMSGNFTQRGEIASFDMYSRAEIACRNGVDLVLEIPPQFVLQSAQFYAYHSIYILNALGIIDYLAFGSECGNIEELATLPCPDVSLLKEKMKTGISYAKAIGESDILQNANNVLGREYLNALKQLNSSIVPFTIRRKNVMHDASVPVDNIASASYIRQKVQSGQDVSLFVPTLPDAKLVCEDRLLPMLNYRLAMTTAEELSNIQNISEGLENRILASRGKNSFSEFVDAVCCKRYPKTRIRRALYSILLNLEQSAQSPSYTRVLSFTETGQKLLRSIKKKSSLAVYSRITKSDITSNQQLRKELICNEVFNLAQLKNQ